MRCKNVLIPEGTVIIWSFIADFFVFLVLWTDFCVLGLRWDDGCGQRHQPGHCRGHFPEGWQVREPRSMFCMGWTRGSGMMKSDPGPTFQVVPDPDPSPSKPGQPKNWQILRVHNGTIARHFKKLKISKEMCRVPYVIKGELDHFEEKFAKILQIFLSKGYIRLRYNYSGSGSWSGAAQKFWIRVDPNLQNWCTLPYSGTVPGIHVPCHSPTWYGYGTYLM